MKKIRTAVIGAGYLGKYHAEKYARIDNADLVAVVDVDREAAEKVAKDVGTKAYTSHKEILGEVDAVSIVVPTPLHYDIGMDFLEKRVDILLEKPMTTTIEQADELIRLAESKKCIIQVGHIERFNPALASVKDRIDKPMFIESHRLSIYNERGTDVCVVLDLMIHDIDIISNFAGSKVKAISATGIPVVSASADIANARIEFENGCIANITASRISTKNERKMRIFQQDAYISVDFGNRETSITAPGDNGASSIIPGMTTTRINCADGDALEEELRSFVSAVSGRTEPEVTGRMGREALKTALSIIEQVEETGRRFRPEG